MDRDAYVVCVLEQLFGALRRRDIFASPSHRWSDPRARLLQGKGWEAVREDVLAGLSLDEDAEQHLRELVAVLDATWKQMAERLQEAGSDAKISIEVQPNGRAKLNVEKLHALGEPKSLKWLRERVEKMLPKIDLPDLLFEVYSWTGFLDAFVHLGDGRTRMKDLTTSVVALLVSEACNIGMTPVINPNHEALTRSRLVHVDQYYLRADTIAAANAALIAAQAQVPIVEHWGKGLLASVDGLRFVVPVRTINAAPSPKYFAKEDRHHMAERHQRPGHRHRADGGARYPARLPVHPGRLVEPGRRGEAGDGRHRQRLLLRHGLWHLQAARLPLLPALQGPSRPAVLEGPDARRRDGRRVRAAGGDRAEQGEREEGDHALAGHAAGRRLPGHQPGPRLRPAEDVRPRGAPAPLGQAFAEYGRIAKTLHLLAVVDPVDDTYRRQMHKQLTVQESRHKLARDICHGKKGTIHQAYRDGMEDQLGALGLVLNAVVLWTTRYIDAAVAQLRAEGYEIRDEDVARLSPLKHKNLNVLGRYNFTASQPVKGLRPLRDPDAVDLDDDDGQEE